MNKLEELTKKYNVAIEMSKDIFLVGENENKVITKKSIIDIKNGMSYDYGHYYIFEYCNDKDMMKVIIDKYTGNFIKEVKDKISIGLGLIVTLDKKNIILYDEWLNKIKTVKCGYLTKDSRIVKKEYDNGKIIITINTNNVITEFIYSIDIKIVVD